MNVRENLYHEALADYRLAWAAAEDAVLRSPDNPQDLAEYLRVPVCFGGRSSYPAYPDSRCAVELHGPGAQELFEALKRLRAAEVVMEES